ncbi:MAG: hypothetical protein DRJ42_06395 [Deltaproteobacteria bacterium]|nr:MAG: hypothetical protein DRJ42_06395 [Deltaproteobacteria bacterium]
MIAAAETDESTRCRPHDAVGVGTCESCGRALCDTCWQRTRHGTEELWCEPCIEHDERTWPWALPVMTVSCSFVGFVGVRNQWMIFWPEADGVLTLIFLFSIVPLGWYSAAIARRKRETPGFVSRTAGAPDSGTVPEHRGGYREAARRRRRPRAALPPLSADETLLTVLGALLAVGTLSVFAFDAWPLWMRFEAVALAFGAVTTGTLTWVVFRGHAVADDRPPMPSRTVSEAETAPHNILFFLMGASAVTGPGVFVVVALGALVLAVFGTMWAVALTFPVLYWLVYRLLGTGLVAVSRRHRHKAGNLGPSLLVGVVGGLVVAAPLAGFVGLRQ